jgi:pimeloyl-ACP methyl ester carboxylesterase
VGIQHANRHVIEADGIKTPIALIGKGPLLLLMAPGGFDSTIDRWGTGRIWGGIDLVNLLAEEFTLVAYDRRECGDAAGRYEVLTYERMAEQALSILDSLETKQDTLMAGCMGCAVALALAAKYPTRVQKLMLHWPVGGAGWQQELSGRFQKHVDHVEKFGLDQLPNHARQRQTSFWKDATVGPWGKSMLNSVDLQIEIAKQDVSEYLARCSHSLSELSGDGLLVGVKASDVQLLEIPVSIYCGNDSVHSPQAATYLSSCFANAEIHNTDINDQSSESVANWIRQSLIRKGKS